VPSLVSTWVRPLAVQLINSGDPRGQVFGFRRGTEVGSVLALLLVRPHN
jgi:hypothetical protein